MLWATWSENRWGVSPVDFERSPRLKPAEGLNQAFPLIFPMGLWVGFPLHVDLNREDPFGVSNSFFMMDWWGLHVLNRWALSLSIHIYIYANILHIRTWESQKNTSKCPTDPVISTPVYPRGTCHAHHHFHPPTHWLRKRQSYALPAAGIRIISCLLILLFHHFPTYSCGSTSGVFNCKGQFLALFHITLQPQWASNLWFSQKLAATSCLQEDWKFGYPPDYIHPESKCFSVLELNFFFRIEPNPETQGTADDLELHCLLRFSSPTNQEDWECQRWGEENWQKIPPLCSLNTRDSFDSFAWMDYLTQRYSWWFRAPSSSPNWTGNQLKDMPKIELATLISYTWSNNWHPSSKLNGKKNSNTLPPWPMEFNCYCSCKIFGH